MLTHLIDTDICIYAMKARSKSLIRKFDGASSTSAISAVTLFELYAGAQGYAEPEKRIEIIEDFSSRLTVLPFSTQAGRIGGALRHQLEIKGQMIGAYDILIAATALANGLILVTNNTREFNRVPALKLEQWA